MPALMSTFSSDKATLSNMERCSMTAIALCSLYGIFLPSSLRPGVDTRASFFSCTLIRRNKHVEAGRRGSPSGPILELWTSGKLQWGCQIKGIQVMLLYPYFNHHHPLSTLCYGRCTSCTLISQFACMVVCFERHTARMQVGGGWR